MSYVLLKDNVRLDPILKCLVLQGFLTNSTVSHVTASVIWTVVKALWRHGCCSRLSTCVGRLCGWCCRQCPLGSNSHNENADHGSALTTVDADYTERSYDEVLADRHDGPSLLVETTDVE